MLQKQRKGVYQFSGRVSSVLFFLSYDRSQRGSLTLSWIPLYVYDNWAFSLPGRFAGLHIGNKIRNIMSKLFLDFNNV
jgi:hypothetical protein